MAKAVQRTLPAKGLGSPATPQNRALLRSVIASAGIRLECTVTTRLGRNLRGSAFPLLSSQCAPLASEPCGLRGSEAVPVSSHDLLLVASRSLVSRGVPAFISNGYGRGKYTLVGCNLYVARYPSKDWRRMKRSAEARCHADILGKRCRLAPVTYRECA